MARHRILKRLGREAAARADDAIINTAARARQAARDLNNGGRFTCSCGEKGCPGSFRSLRAQKAHAARHAARQAGRWTSKAARQAATRMGRPLDDARRTALHWLEAAGLKEWRKVPIRDKDGNARTRKDGSVMTREIPVDTARRRSRPEVTTGRGKITPIRELRQADRHDRAAERTDARAAKHEARAAKHEARGRAEKAGQSRQRAINVRQAHHQQWPERRPASARPVPADANGHRPAPARAGRTPR